MRLGCPDRNQLLVRGAQWFVVAETAAKSRLRGKFARANQVRHFRDFFPGFFQRFGIARRGHSFIRHQIVEHQPHRIEVEHFFRRQRVHAKLQIFRRGLRVLRPAGFVINNLDSISVEAVHLVHSPRDNHVVLQRKLESFFLVQHVSRRPAVAAMKRLELVASRLAIFLFVIVVNESRGRPFAIVNPENFLQGNFLALAVFRHKFS